MNIPSVLSRREALRWAARVAVGAGAAACAPFADDARRRFGWEAAANLPPGPYRVQVWRPPGPQTEPVFVVTFAKAGVAPVRIFEPDGVVDRGEVAPAAVVSELRDRSSTLLPGDVEVEPLVADTESLGYVVHTRNIDIYAYLDRSRGLYWVRLYGQGKYRKKGGGAGR